MKRCSRCGGEKPLSEFHFRPDRLTPMPHCKPCQNEYCREHYRANVGAYITKAKRAKQRDRAWYDDMKSKLRCEKCGEDDPACLDFHHNGNGKDAAVSVMLYRTGRKKLIKEIEKCSVLCANCHRKLHRDLRAGSTNGTVHLTTN